MIKFKEIFKSFSSPYLKVANEREHSDYQLKYDHSLRVFENCQGICESLDLTPEQTQTAEIAALFHDTGRFPQYFKYKTFKDSDSCNHATMGVKQIIRGKLLRDLPKSQLRIILGAIALHNRMAIPAHIPEQLRTVTQIIRDSDKIDIMGIMLAHMSDSKHLGSVALMGLEEKPDEVTGSVLSSVESGKQAIYTDMTCINDFRLLILSWAYDLNYKWSKKQMIDRNVVRQIFSQLPDIPRVASLYDPIMNHLNS
ncbi:HD domain-containing protein [Maridesulfovibrio frigidus]|uniref:HD domain-containing protein n=1 Tax=Maridesulfovibrio frigidus TaxID=340956 RepID=UPI0004E1C1FA|nr:HD domain-containing protein [Maridesulfovibrio frigidus]